MSIRVSIDFGNRRAADFLRALSCMALCGLLAACGPAQEPAGGPGPESAEHPSTTAERLKPEAPGAAASLDAIIEQYAQATRAEEDQAPLKNVSAEAFLQEIEDNRELLERLGKIDVGGLSLEERIDHRLLMGLLESDIYSAEKRRIWENDASIYIPAGQIGRLLEPAAVEPAGERATSLLAVLAKLPDQLETAEKNLRTPPRRFTEAAVFKVEGTIESLQRDAPALAGAGQITEADFTETLDAAVQRLADFGRFLREDLLPRSTGNWAVGKEHYDYIIQHRWLLDADADDILARGWQAFEQTEALAQEVSERIEPGRHWAEVYETLKDEHPPADGIKAAYQQAIDAAQQFVIEHQIVTLPAGERVVTVDTPPAMRRSSPFGTFQSVDRFGDDLEGKLVLTPIEDWMSPEQKAARLRSHHDAWIPIIAVHEAYPGHHVDALKTRENPRLLRKIVREPIFSEGWGLFTEEMMFEMGFLQGDDVRLTQLRNRLWRAARVILDSSLHTGRMTFEEAVDFLAERVRFERYAAELEVGMYIQNPTYVLGYLIGMQEIMQIRHDWIEANGEPDPPSEFYDPLLTVGALPPVLVRESLLGGADSAPYTTAADR